MDFKRYWAAVEAEAARIEDEWPMVVGVDDPMRGLQVGCPVQVSREEAAKMIVEKRGRLATAEEIAAEAKRIDAVMERLGEIDLDRRMLEAVSPVLYGQRATEAPPVAKPTPAKTPPADESAPTEKEIETFDLAAIKPGMSKRQKAAAFAAIARASAARMQRG